MDDRVKKVVRKVSEKKGILTFLKAQFSSQVATLFDFAVTVILATLFQTHYVYAVFTGAVCGGVVNCIVNYKWTFKATGLKKRYVAAKYLFVWLVAIALNTYGTYFLTESLSKIGWMENFLGHFFGSLFIACKMVVALLVALLWSYEMQYYFVYKDRNIRKFFSNFVGS